MFGYNNANCAYTKKELISILHKLIDPSGLSIQDISKETGVSVDVLKQISCGRTHVWLADEQPEAYSKLI